MIANDTYPFNSRIGMGTFGFGTPMADSQEDINSLVNALNLGYRVFDTAEQYASGGAETCLGNAIKAWGGNRAELQIVSKILPANATSKEKVIEHFEASLRRLGTGYIDVYLLHWFLPETDLGSVLDAFLELKQRGLLKTFGLSNFNPTHLKMWKDLEVERGIDPKSKQGATVLQTRLNLQERLVDRYLVKFVKREYGMSVMAHTPLAKRMLARDSRLTELSRELGVTNAEVALAWILRYPHVIAIPKAAHPEKQEINLKAENLILPQAMLDRLDELFPIPPKPPEA